MQRIWENRSVRAVGTLFGTVVGVGLFGLPYVFSRSGFLLGLLELVVLSVVMIVLFLMYAEITVQTEGKHRFVTYMQRYLGPVGKHVAAAAFLFSMFGSLLAFTIVGGQALASLSGWSEVASTFILLAVVALVIYHGIPFVSRLEVWIVAMILILYALLVLLSLTQFDAQNLLTPPANFSDAVLPYAVIIFALSGFGAIPEMHDILDREYRRLPKVLVCGYLLIISLYVGFTLAILGAVGQSVSPSALSSLPLITSSPFVLFAGSILGIIAVFSVFSVTATELMATLRIDFRLPKPAAWGLTVGTPALLYGLGVRTFIDVLGIVGGIFAAVSGTLVVLAYERMKRTKGCEKKKCFRLPAVASYLVMAAFLVGAVIEIVYTIL